MRYISLSLFLWFLLHLPFEAAAQTKFGIRAGVNTFLLPDNEISVSDATGNTLGVIDMAQSKIGFHAGLFLQVQSNFLFMQPEIWFRNANITYNWRTISEPQESATIEENYQYIDVPLQFGLKAGPVRAGIGPIGQFFISSRSDFSDLPEFSSQYQATYTEISVGYIAGIGIDIWNFHVDVNYEGQLRDFGDHIMIFDEAYSFGRPAARLIASVGVSF